jgi:hypothetical protein
LLATISACSSASVRPARASVTAARLAAVIAVAD